MVSRTSSGKFLRVESCYPESFGFLRLCDCDYHHAGDLNNHFCSHFQSRCSWPRRNHSSQPLLWQPAGRIRQPGVEEKTVVKQNQFGYSTDKKAFRQKNGQYLCKSSLFWGSPSAFCYSSFASRNLGEMFLMVISNLVNIIIQRNEIVKNILFSALMDSWTQVWRGHDILLSENLSTFKPLSW